MVLSGLASSMGVSCRFSLQADDDSGGPLGIHMQVSQLACGHVFHVSFPWRMVEGLLLGALKFTLSKNVIKRGSLGNPRTTWRL